MAAPEGSTTLAPAVSPGSITDAELHHLRLLRSLDPSIRQGILDMARIGIGSVADARNHAKPTLQLVVNN